MGQLDVVRRVLAVKHDRNDLLFGVVCIALGCLALTLSWFAFRGPSETHPSIEATRSLTTSPPKAFGGL